MRVFVLGTGRCGTMTFAKACSHITNYTSGHETHRLHPERFPVYPDQHIEVDAHLAWMLASVAGRYSRKGVKYIHLLRDPKDVAQSFLPRPGAQMLLATIFQKRPPYCLNDMRQLVDVINANIRWFLSDQESIAVSIESLAAKRNSEVWRVVWDYIGAEGDMEAGREEFKIRYNASQTATAIVPPNMNRMTLNVTWQCNQRCPKCVQRSLVRGYGDYHMSMEELETFIAASGGHRFDTLTLSGGEPLLWKHLEEGVARLRASGIVMNRLNIFSNGSLPDKITPTLMDNLDELRISDYGDKRDLIQEFIRRYGKKISCVNRTVMVEPPAQLLPAEEVMPAECSCLGWMVTRGWAYPCAMVPAVMAECRMNHEDYSALMCPVEPGYLEKLAPYVPACYDHCRGCFSNMKVRRRLRTS